MENAKKAKKRVTTIIFRPHARTARVPPTTATVQPPRISGFMMDSKNGPGGKIGRKR